MIPQATHEEEQLAINIHHKFKEMDIPTLVDALDDEKLSIYMTRLLVGLHSLRS